MKGYATSVRTSWCDVKDIAYHPRWAGIWNDARRGDKGRFYTNVTKPSMVRLNRLFTERIPMAEGWLGVKIEAIAYRFP